MTKKTNNIIIWSVTAVLAVATGAMIYLMYNTIAQPVKFESERAEREAAVIARLKTIREAERNFKKHHGHFTASFDTLIDFVLHGEMKSERRIVDEDDSVRLAQYRAKYGKKWQNVETFTFKVKDSLFKDLDTTQIKEMRYIPYTGNKTEFILAAGFHTTEHTKIPIVECCAPYKAFLDTAVYRQEIINIIDQLKDNKDINKQYPGLKFGSMQLGNNEAGNWE